MKILAAVYGFVERALADWREVRLSELVFGERDLALLVTIALAGIAVVALVLRSVHAAHARPGQRRAAGDARHLVAVVAALGAPPAAGAGAGRAAAVRHRPGRSGHPAVAPRSDPARAAASP